MVQVVSVSVPRSGHHFLISVLREYIGLEGFRYCEMYSEATCCKKFPCSRIDSEHESSNLFMQKTHDMLNELPFPREGRFLIQTRAPSQAAVAWLRWAAAHGEYLSPSEFSVAIFRFFCYYILFFHKWCFAPLSDTFILRYEEIRVAGRDREDKISDLFRWLGIEVDRDKLVSALAAVSRRDAHGSDRWHGADNIYDAAGLNDLTGQMFGFCLKMVEKLCPGIKLSDSDRGFECDRVSSDFSSLFFPFDVINGGQVELEFSGQRFINSYSKGLGWFRSQCSVPRELGLSRPEAGFGSWSDGDIFVIPLQVSSRVKSLAVKLSFAAIPQLKPERDIQIYSVLDGSFFGGSSAVYREDQAWLLDARFEFEASGFLFNRVGGVVFRILGLQRYDSAERRKLGLLVKKVLFESVVLE